MPREYEDEAIELPPFLDDDYGYDNDEEEEENNDLTREEDE